MTVDLTEDDIDGLFEAVAKDTDLSWLPEGGKGIDRRLDAADDARHEAMMKEQAEENL